MPGFWNPEGFWDLASVPAGPHAESSPGTMIPGRGGVCSSLHAALWRSFQFGGNGLLAEGREDHWPTENEVGTVSISGFCVLRDRSSLDARSEHVGCTCCVEVCRRAHPARRLASCESAKGAGRPLGTCGKGGLERSLILKIPIYIINQYETSRLLIIKYHY